MKTTKQSQDIFARIATERLQQRDQSQVELAPVECDGKLLPLKKGDAKAFKPGNKITTAAQLDKELKRQRSRFERYMQNHAPLLPDFRESVSLTKFNWREESADDRSDFNNVLSGEGRWSKVTIPHYGPPLGKAVTCYRTTFRVTRSMLNRGALFACFAGVDYKAQVFINNSFVGEHEGFFAPFEFDFTHYAKVGSNVLVVRVENDATQLGNHQGEEAICGDKMYAATGCGYDDPELGWHHCPPGMGIYQDVRIEARSTLFIKHLFVRPLTYSSSAELWIEIYNCDSSEKPVEFEISIHGRNFKKRVLADYRVRPSTCQHRGHGDLDQFTNPSVDEPAGCGINYYRIPVEIPDFREWGTLTPWLYQLQVKLLESGSRVDSAEQQFGMRSFVQDENSTPKGKFYLNGSEIRLRGANTMGHLQQCVMRGDLDQLRDDILLARICHMNFLRLTQRPVQKKIYELCDQLGMMTQTDLPLFGVLRRNQMVEAVRQSGEMEQLVRSHPCNVMISYINEPYPNASGKPHRHLTRNELDNFFDIASKVVRQLNPDRVIKYCDGDYDPPTVAGMPDNHCYCGWYIGHGLDLGRLNRGYWIPVKEGWHYGCGEYGAEGLDNYDVMEKYYPAKWLPSKKRADLAWTPGVIPKAQSERFHFLWYETPSTVNEWIEASQKHQAWIVRMMTEAFRRDCRMNSFALHLFIDAWPSGWMKTVMDVDRKPKSSFFEYRDALTPLMVSLRSDRGAYCAGERFELEAWICNDTVEVLAGCTLRYQLECGSRIVQSGSVKADIPSCSSRLQGMLPFTAPATDARTTLTARVGLIDSNGKVMHDTLMTFDLFPALPSFAGMKVFVPQGDKSGAAEMVRQMGAESLYNGVPGAGDTIVIYGAVWTKKQQAEILRAVSNGALALYLELPPGEYKVGTEKIKVKSPGMGNRHFVSCGTGHDLVKGFEPDDFKFWYDASRSYVTPILESVICESDGWDSILQSGDGDWQSAWSKVPVVIEKRIGKGLVRISQVKLLHRIEHNPAAAQFTFNLLSRS